MRKIISLVLVLLLVFMVGCTYVAQPQTEDKGITPINLTEILNNSKSTQETKVVSKPVTKPAEEVKTTVKEMPTVKVTEGDLVSFPNLKATDPDGDKIAYTFSKPLSDKGEWQTKEGDAGEYTATITASDGTNKISQDVKIVVDTLNKAPVMEKIADITIKEGETLKLAPKALDPEGKEVKLTYSGWMASDTKKLDYNSAGTYVVRVTASDGSKETFQDVKITVEDVNRAPEFINIV